MVRALALAKTWKSALKNKHNNNNNNNTPTSVFRNVRFDNVWQCLVDVQLPGNEGLADGGGVVAEHQGLPSHLVVERLQVDVAGSRPVLQNTFTFARFRFPSLQAYTARRLLPHCCFSFVFVCVGFAHSQTSWFPLFALWFCTVSNLVVSSVCSSVLHTHKPRGFLCLLFGFAQSQTSWFPLFALWFCTFTNVFVSSAAHFCCAHSQTSLSPLFDLSFCILTNFALLLFLCVHTHKLHSLDPLFFFLHTRGLRYLLCCVCTLTNSVVSSVVFSHSQTSLSPLLFLHTRKLHCLLCCVCTLTNIAFSAVVFSHSQTSLSPLLCLHTHKQRCLICFFAHTQTSFFSSVVFAVTNFFLPCCSLFLHYIHSMLHSF